MLKIVYFNGDYQFFQKSPWIFLYYQIGKFIHLLALETQFGTKKALSVKLSIGEATGAHSTAALEQCVSNVNTKSRVDTKSRLRTQSRFCIK